MVLWSESNESDRQRNWFLERLKSLFVIPFESAHVYGLSNAEYLIKLGMRGESIFRRRAVLDTNLFNTMADHREFGPYIFIFVGRFVAEKNLHFLIDSFGALRRRFPSADWRLRLIGDGPERASLEKRSIALGI